MRPFGYIVVPCPSELLDDLVRAEQDQGLDGEADRLRRAPLGSYVLVGWLAENL